MRLLKLFAMSVLAFFVLLTLIGLLFPSKIQSIKAIVVNKPQYIVVNELELNTGWIMWYPFFTTANKYAIQSMNADTSIFISEKTRLFVYNKSADSNSVHFNLKMLNSSEVKETIIALPINDDTTQTQVVWNETEHLKWYPWERFRGLLLESSKGIFLDTALHNFKRYIEARK